MPYHSRFFEAMKDEVAPVIYHPCGGEYPILCLVSRMPFVDAFHFSELVDLGVVREIYGAKSILWGNVHPYGTLMADSPERVVDEVEDIIQKAGKRGRLIMAPG